MRKHRRAVCLSLVLLLLASLGMSAASAQQALISYLQDKEQIYVMEAGILKRNLAFAQGEDVALRYDFDQAEYAALRREYDLSAIAGDGSEWERARNLMHAFAARLTHRSDYDNHVEMNAAALLAYSLDQPAHGINCRSKAQILNEMCLALGLYARKVWIMPNSEYDNDCHVVNEVWDSTLGQWVMLDITNDEYWLDEDSRPLSVLDIRRKGAERSYCAPAKPEDDPRKPRSLRDKHYADFLYIMKNMAYMRYCEAYTLGETNVWTLLPEGWDADGAPLLSVESVTRAPY